MQTNTLALFRYNQASIAFLYYFLSFLFPSYSFLTVLYEIRSYDSTAHLHCVNTLEEENISPLQVYPTPLCSEKANPPVHHKRTVTHTCTVPGSLAGKMYFQIWATDNYVSNKNKPFLPGMLQQNHLSVSVFSRHTALQLWVLRSACTVCDYVSNGSKTVPCFNRVSSPWQPS